jgi:hypothetical protein
MVQQQLRIKVHAALRRDEVMRIGYRIRPGSPRERPRGGVPEVEREDDADLDPPRVSADQGTADPPCIDPDSGAANCLEWGVCEPGGGHRRPPLLDCLRRAQEWFRFSTAVLLIGGTDARKEGLQANP